MSLPEAIEPPAGLSFGALLDWHLRRGTRPPGTPNQGECHGKSMAFASNVGLTDKQVRNWIAATKACRTIPSPSNGVLFGRDQAHRVALADATARCAQAHADGTAPGRFATRNATAAARPASNIPIRVPTHFMGRDDALAQIAAALAQHEGRVAITALHGLRGVGKTTLAAAYADRHRGDYRATWWIRAQSETSMRADLVGLGMRLGWVRPDDKEEPALAAVMERLRHEGEGLCSSTTMPSMPMRAETSSAARRRGARAGHLQRPCLARRRRAGRNPRLAQGDRRGLPHRPHRPRQPSAPPPRRCRRRSAACPWRTSRPRPIASGSKSLSPNIENASPPRR